MLNLSTPLPSRLCRYAAQSTPSPSRLCRYAALACPCVASLSNAVNCHSLSKLTRSLAGQYVARLTAHPRTVNTSESFWLQDLFQRYTLESIAELGFGVSLGCLQSEVLPACLPDAILCPICPWLILLYICACLPLDIHCLFAPAVSICLCMAVSLLLVVCLVGSIGPLGELLNT